MTADTAVQNYLGRCKECNFALFATEEDVRAAASFADMKQPGIAYRLSDGGTFARCPNRHRVFFMKVVKGTFSKDHNCDSRCLNAKGNDCTCSCGGANHGRGHVAAMVYEASEAIPEAPKRFLGEIGKHITGEVEVQYKRLVEGQYKSMLYVFVTLDETAIIKWFAPLQYDPNFETGQKLKIRAKVKKHDENERFGNATIVTYLEEV